MTLIILFMRKIFLIGLLFVAAMANASESKTKLVVGITISNFYPEWLSVYRNDLSEGGLKRILNGGKRAMADYNYLFSQTGVDQATIYTGMLPSAHGVVQHQWYDRLRNRRQGNVASEQHTLIGEEQDGNGLSPEGVQALSLGCAMKMHDAFAKVYSISMNGEEAVLSGGNCANMALWFSETNGKWVSSKYYADSLSGWLKDYNSKMESDFYIRRGWMPLAEETSNSTALRLKNKVGAGSSFYYDINQAKRKFDTYRVLKATPYANTMVVDLAGRLIKEEKLGTDNDADFLSLHFSCLDYMNRDFGVCAPEFKDLLLRLDRDVERLFEILDKQAGKENYSVFLTFSEARELLPEELEKMNIASGYFSVFKAVALLKSYLNVVYGEGEWIQDYDAGQIYLNRSLVEKNKLSLKDMQDKVADFMIEFEGVAWVFTAYSLTHNVSSSGVGALFLNSFSQKKSGDVLFSLQSTWIPELKDAEDNYARYSKRNKVPLFFYGAGVGEMLRPECEMVDVLPTLCRMLNIPIPYMAQGKNILK